MPLVLLKEIVLFSIYNRIPSLLLSILFWWWVVARWWIIFKCSCKITGKLSVTFQLCLPLCCFFLKLYLLKHLDLINCGNFTYLINVVICFSIFSFVAALIFLFTLLWFFLWCFCSDINNLCFRRCRVEITTRMYIW